MNGSVPPRRVPTLTEVVSWPSTQQPPSASPDAAAALPVFDEDQIVQRVLSGLQRQIDLVLEYRLRETLTPLLTRAADGIVREARAELSAGLKDIVERAVAQELARHRPR